MTSDIGGQVAEARPEPRREAGCRIVADRQSNRENRRVCAVQKRKRVGHAHVLQNLPEGQVLRRKPSPQRCWTALCVACDLFNRPRVCRVAQQQAAQPQADPVGFGCRKADAPFLQPHEDLAQPVIVAGARRVRAAQLAELFSLPARIVELTNSQAMEWQLVENSQRVDVHPYEEAQGFQRLLDFPGYDVTALVEKSGKSAAHIYARLSLLQLIPAVAEAFVQERICLDNDCSVHHPQTVVQRPAGPPPVMEPAPEQETEEEAAQRQAEHEQRMADYEAEQKRNPALLKAICPLCLWMSRSPPCDRA